MFFVCTVFLNNIIGCWGCLCYHLYPAIFVFRTLWKSATTWDDGKEKVRTRQRSQWASGRKAKMSGNGSVLDQQVVRRSMPNIKEMPYKYHPNIVQRSSKYHPPKQPMCTSHLFLKWDPSGPDHRIHCRQYCLSQVGRTSQHLDDLMRYESNFFGGYLSHLRFVALNLHCFFGPTIVWIATPKIWWKFMYLGTTAKKQRSQRFFF